MLFIIRARVFGKFIRNMSKAGSSGKSNRKHVAVSYEKDDETQVTEKKPKKEEPKNWQQIYENIAAMRNEHPAPVDTMGCEKCADPKADDETQKYQILVALMLSSQTKDEVTFHAMERLKQFGLTVANIANADQKELEELVHPVGFFRQKSKHIIQTAIILRDQYESRVPNSLTELLKLPGIGKKMANIALACCFNIVVGIGVDVHVHRISNRLRWVNSKTPEQTQQQLESWLPHEYWKEVNLNLVGFGQTICTPKNPKCDECLNSEICPYAKENSTNKKKK
jgi:endonuclease-3